MLPFVHEAVKEEPEELLPVLSSVEAPVLGLLIIEADTGLVLDVTPEVNLVRSRRNGSSESNMFCIMETGLAQASSDTVNTVDMAAMA